MKKRNSAIVIFLAMYVFVSLFTTACATEEMKTDSGKFSNGLPYMFTSEHLDNLKTAYFIATHLAGHLMVEEVHKKIISFNEREEELCATEAIYIAYDIIQKEWGLSDLEIAQLFPFIDYHEYGFQKAKWGVYFNPAIPNLGKEVFYGVEIDSINGTLIRTWDISETEG